MAVSDLLRLVLANLRRMKARVAMTAIGVIIGTAAVVVLISLASGLQRSATQDLGDVYDLTRITVFPASFLRSFGGSQARPDEGVLDERALDAFRDLPGVQAVTPWVGLSGVPVLRLNRLTSNVQVVGLDPRAMDALSFDLASGMDRLGRWQAVVGARIGETFYNPQQAPQQRQAGERLDLQGQSLQLTLSRLGDDGRPVERTVRLRVVGVLAETGGQDDYTLFLAVNDVLELNSWHTGARVNPGRDGYNQALVKVASIDQVLSVEQEILNRGFFAYSLRSTLQQLNVFFLVIQGVFGGIGAIALIVAAFGIANTMMMSIYERTREIGLMKAVGATNRDVMAVFLAEAGAIGFLGGLGGVLLGVGLGLLGDFLAGTYLAAQAVQSGGAGVDISILHTPLWLPIFALLFSIVVGVISGIYPAVRAASLSPIAALKYE
ncbi:MAG TPA: ABC transporter permease [Chloroflexi bacterium]|nr:ABC transporter permease [Chloroflexota bacterium]